MGLTRAFLAFKVGLGTAATRQGVGIEPKEAAEGQAMLLLLGATMQ